MKPCEVSRPLRLWRKGTEMIDNAETAPTTEHLSETVCWSLLAQAQVGRLGVAVLGIVEIIPVNFVVDRMRIVFRTSPGHKLFVLTLRNSVAFEVDGWDDGSAWSVLVKGVAEPLRTHAEIRDASHTGLESWAPDPKNTYVQILPSEVTGRRFARAPQAEKVWYW